MPDYATVIEMVKVDDGLLLLVMLICTAATLAVIRAQHSPAVVRLIYWYHRPMLYLPRPALPRPSINLIMFIGLLLRLPLLSGSLWYDEAFTARLMELPVEMVPGAILSDTHPFAYYFFLRGWATLFGTSPIMLRLPSVLLSLVCIYLAYKLVRSLKLSHATGLGAAALVATLPASIMHGSEARSYMLLTALVMFSALMIFERKPKWFGLSLTLILWTHNVGILYVLALIGSCAIYNPKDARRWLVPIAIGTAIGFLWIPFLILQSQIVADGFWTYFSAGFIARSLFLMTFLNIASAIPLTVITVLSLWKLRKWLRSNHGEAWFALVFTPAALMVVISLLFQPVFTFRHLLPAVMIFIVAWSYLLSRSRLALTVVASVIVLSLITFFTSGINTARPDYRRLIAQHCSEADSFFATSINSAFLTMANDDRPTLVWQGAKDNGLTLTQASLSMFNIPVGNLSELEGQIVCIMQIERPETFESERVMIAFLQEIYEIESTVVHLGIYNDLVFHRLEVQG